MQVCRTYTGKFRAQGHAEGNKEFPFEDFNIIKQGLLLETASTCMKLVPSLSTHGGSKGYIAVPAV